MLRTPLLSFIYLLLLVSHAYAQPSAFSLPQGGSFILPITQGKVLLNQCSRDAPADISGYWQPSIDEVENLEKRLITFIRSSSSASGRRPNNIAYHRQYLGITVRGKHLIYGNFYPADLPSKDKEDSLPVIICDGGSSFWGVVFSPETGLFLELSLNGEA